MREAIVPARGAKPLRGLFTVETDVDDGRVDDRGLDGERRRDIHHDVAVAHRVGQVLLILGRDVDGQAIAGGGARRPERFFDQHVRHTLKRRVRGHVVARMQPDEQLRGDGHAPPVIARTSTRTT